MMTVSNSNLFSSFSVSNVAVYDDTHSPYRQALIKPYRVEYLYRYVLP